MFPSASIQATITFSFSFFNRISIIRSSEHLSPISPRISTKNFISSSLVMFGSFSQIALIELVPFFSNISPARFRIEISSELMYSITRDGMVEWLL